MTTRHTLFQMRILIYHIHNCLTKYKSLCIIVNEFYGIYQRHETVYRICIRTLTFNYSGTRIIFLKIGSSYSKQSPTMTCVFGKLHCNWLNHCREIVLISSDIILFARIRIAALHLIKKSICDYYLLSSEIAKYIGEVYIIVRWKIIHKEWVGLQ